MSKYFSTVTMSQKYLHPSPEFLERAVQAMEKLNPAKHKETGSPPQHSNNRLIKNNLYL